MGRGRPHSPLFPVWRRGKGRTAVLSVFWLQHCGQCWGLEITLLKAMSHAAPQATAGPSQAGQRCQLGAGPAAAASPPAVCWKPLPGARCPGWPTDLGRGSRGVPSFNRCAFGMPGARVKKHDSVNRRFNIEPKCQGLKHLLEQWKCLGEAEVKAQNAIEFL